MFCIPNNICSDELFFLFVSAFSQHFLFHLSYNVCFNSSYSGHLDEFLISLISRFFVVWIMATLMRPASCTDESSNDALDSRVSTELNISCVDEGASLAALPLLLYFLVTSTILHADEIDLLQTSDHIRDIYVRYSPLYTIFIRIVQVCALVLCMTRPGMESGTTVALVIILLICLLPSAYVYCSSTSTCSMVVMTPLRAGCFLWTSWTALCCYVRSQVAFDEHWIFIGWAIIFVISASVGINLDTVERKNYQRLLEENGLNQAVAELTDLIQDLMVDSALRGKLEVSTIVIIFYVHF